jgi:hypothetical protein
MRTVGGKKGMLGGEGVGYLHNFYFIFSFEKPVVIVLVLVSANCFSHQAYFIHIDSWIAVFFISLQN